MPPEPCQIGILFGDVAGSTRLYQNLGDSAAHRAVQGALELMADCVLKAGGVIVKTVGDEVMAAFFRPEPMIEAALEMQRRATRRAETEADIAARVKLRIGLHFGPALRSGADYFGQTVNTAARMVAIAKADEIITAHDLREELAGRERDLFRPLEAFRLKGMGDDLAIAEVVWHQTSQLTELPELFRAPMPPAASHQLHLQHGSSKWVLDPRDPPFQIGREAENTLCILDARVSRRHATIERRIASWILFDHSSNGSFVTFEGGRELQLRRHELVLHGNGVVSFGQSSTQPGVPSLIFRLHSA